MKENTSTIITTGEVKEYFYQLLKPLSNVANVSSDDFVDWGHEVKYETAIGVGECAGVVIDLVATLLYEADEKAGWAKETLEKGQFADSIYHSYSAILGAAKALLLDKQVNCNTQHGIINDFDKHFVAEKLFHFEPNFKTFVLQINQNEPTKEFAGRYFSEAEQFIQQAKTFREGQLNAEELKLVTVPVNNSKAEG